MRRLRLPELAAEKGYEIEGGAKGKLTFIKGDRKLSIDQELVDDIVSAASPVENTDKESRVQAVAS
ncbi:MAG: hypothetical protein ACR2QF_05505 [Geminicoccaceae bacterium]